FSSLLPASEMGIGTRWNSGGFFDAARADARRAHADMLSDAVNDRPYLPQIRIPAPTPSVIRVADHIPKVRRFAAQITLRHLRIPAFVELPVAAGRQTRQQIGRNLPQTEHLSVADPAVTTKCGYLQQ